MRHALALVFLLAGCGEPEPAPTSEPARQDRSTEAREEPAPPREPDEPGEPGEPGGPGEPSEAEPGAGEASADPDQAESEALPPRVLEACNHPFVPTRVGQSRTYRWRETGEDRAARLTLVAVRSREVGAEHELRWRATITADDDRSELGTAELDVRCDPEGAEEPWFGVIERSLGLRPTRDGRRWRWPAVLARGERFEGEATFDPSTADMQRPADVRGPQLVRVERSYVVEDRETVTAEAGRFETWRVRFTERHAFGDRGETGNGVVWIAQGAGMVRARLMSSRGIEQTWELVAQRDPAP